MEIILELAVDELYRQGKSSEQKKEAEENTRLDSLVKQSDTETATEESSEAPLDKAEMIYSRENEPFGESYTSSPLYLSSLNHLEQKRMYLPEEEEENPQGWIVEQQEAETMTREEAEEAIREVQYSTVCGTYGDIDNRTRERLATSALFDPSGFWLTERLGRVTTDVDYSRRF